MHNGNCQIFKILVDGRRKKLTQQTIHDNERLNIRMLQNKPRLQIIDRKMVNKKGKKMTMYELYNLAQTISNVTNRKIDRLARRNRNGLLCWLAESIDIISNQQTLDEIRKRVQLNNDQQLNQHELRNIEQEDQPQSNNENITKDYPKIIFSKSINTPRLSINDPKNGALIQRQIFPEIPDQFYLPPLINLNANNNNNNSNPPKDLISVLNLLNHA